MNIAGRAVVCVLLLLASVGRARADADLWQPPRRSLVVKAGVEWGLTYWCERGPWGTRNGVGSAMNAGYGGGLRASVEFRRWVALDVRLHLAYTGARNEVAGGAAFLTIGGFVGARFTIPFRRARPYLIVGPGVYSTQVRGTGPTPRFGSTAPGIAGGLGIEVPLTPKMSVGAEYVFHHKLGERYSDVSAIQRGDPVTFDLFAQYTF